MEGPRIQLGLGTTRALCAALGNPQRSYPCVLIAGTNGKGSTAAMLAQIAGVAGLKVGLFHSPSLGGLHEHIVIGGSPISPRRHASLEREVRSAGEGGGRVPTPFERLTATAFLAFARSGVDLAVIEAGLGGARDATNVCEPEVSVLVTVALDHQEHLGSTLDAIARDKAGIFRADKPAILGWLPEPAREEARRIAGRIGSRLIDAYDGLAFEAGPDGAHELVVEERRYRLKPGLAGAHQIRNAALAALAADSLRGRLPVLEPGAVENGVASCQLPGRLEWRVPSGSEPPGDRRLLLDGAHNPAAARALAEHLGRVERRTGLRHDLLFGAFADKDSAAMLDFLRPHTGRVWLTALEHERSWRRGAAPPTLPWFESPVSALRQALGEGRATHPPRPLLVTGSMALIAAVRPFSAPADPPHQPRLSGEAR